ncbi:MAG: hypothetical protein IKJ05_06180 [Oscillospiraceae bacterium]|nr:hypothetical protein [Oscillospiraceae bacterium]
MKIINFRKVISAALAAIMVCTMSVNALAVTAFATDGQVSQDIPVVTEDTTVDPRPTAEPTAEPAADPTPEPTPVPTAEPTPRPTAVPTATPRPTATPQPTAVPFVTTNDNIYIANYRVVNSSGSPLAKVNPGDKVILSVSVIDERIKADEFGVPAGQNTGRIHINMGQGAFSIPSSAVIDVKMRNPVTVMNADGIDYQALSYTVTFRDVTYLGGAPALGFGISYTGRNGTNTDNNMPLPYPHTTLNMNVTQATDDVPAPQIILNNANYGKVAIIGEPFALVTTATNTSTNLDLDNVSLKIVLPQGITLSTGNSQVLIGQVAKGGTIDHTFALIAEGVANDVKSLPVQLIYSYEAFVGGKRTQFTSQQDISINVQQPTRFEIQNMFNDMEMFMGNESYMSASLVNKGKTTVYNVTAELVSETLTAYDVEFLGNIMPGSTANAEFDFTASQVGTSTGKLVVTYEDASGTQYTMERDFSIEVMEQPVWNEPVVDMPVMEPEQPSIPVIPVVIGAVAIAAGGFFFWKKKQKAKRLAELEDEDEDI